MQIHYYMIRVVEPEPQVTELNRLLAEHPDAQVEQHLVNDASRSFWAVSVNVPTMFGSQTTVTTKKRSRIDYREILSDKHFARYAKLREFRNKLAENKGIKPFLIFTNEQLAAMAQLPVVDRASIALIEGVGKMRIEEYSAVFSELLEPLVDEGNDE